MNEHWVDEVYFCKFKKYSTCHRMYKTDEVAELAKRGLEANIMRRKGDQFGWDRFIAELEQIVKEGRDG